jgi:hypothetical protein
VGNHNFAALASQDGPQKGFESTSFPVETRADVGEEAAWFGGAGPLEGGEVGHLALEVVSLLGGGDSGVEDGLLLRLDPTGASLVHKGVDVVDVVEAVSAWRAGAPNETTGCPSLERFGGDVVCCPNVFRLDIHAGPLG